MSTVAITRTSTATFETEGSDRSEFRYTGWMIAISASLALWTAIGVGIWSLVSTLG